MDLVIYGAQGIALGTYEAIYNLCPKRKVSCFLVTERGRNAEFLSGLPVLELNSYAKTLSEEEKQKVEVLIATPEPVMPEIEAALDARGLFCHVRLTSGRWAELMSYHYVCGQEFMPLRALPVGCCRANMHVFMAKFYKDRPLTGRYDLPGWITPIQVGAALCKERVANLLDCDGENISWKNGNYSELTALYWMWKNRLVYPSAEERKEYYGLAHYRRVLDLTDDDLLRLASNEVDAVLPYPMPYEPDIGAHHERYLKQEDWDAVQRAVQELQPEYARSFPEILGQRFLYNYNLVLGKKEVLRAYCEWLFPILERVEALSVPNGSERSDRYLGYIGETLTTLYFMHQKEHLHMVHAGCRFLT